MAGSRSGDASQIGRRLALLFHRLAQGPQFIDPRAYSWARQVKSYSELPSQYRPFFEIHSAGVPHVFPYSVLTPTFRGVYGQPQVERLLCIQAGSVDVLEATGDRLSCISYAAEHVQMIEVGVLLLHSWMAIYGQADSGKAQSTTIRFNSISDYLMAPFVECLRGPDLEDPASSLERERAKLDYLAEAHYKFRTYGRASLRRGDTVRKIIFQPEIRHERMRCLGIPLTRLISPAHLSILSERELINIRDDPSQRWSKGPPHGAIWTYIPRSKITGAVLTSRANGTHELSVQVQGGLGIRSLFDADKIRQLEAMIGAWSI